MLSSYLTSTALAVLLFLSAPLVESSNFDFAVVDFLKSDEENVAILKTCISDVGFFYVSNIPGMNDHLTLQLHRWAEVSFWVCF